MDLKIKMPETINDIPLSKWMEYNEATKIKDADVNFLNRRALSIFYGVRGDIFPHIKMVDMKMLLNHIDTMLSNVPKLTRRFELGGVEYGLIPNFDDMTFGEFVDLDKYSITGDYPRIMSILYRKLKETGVGGRYSIVPYSGSNDELRDMPTGIAIGCVNFFLTIANQLTSDILKSSMRDFPTETTRILEKSGVGMGQSILWRGGTLRDLTELLNGTLTKYSPN